MQKILFYVEKRVTIEKVERGIDNIEKFIEQATRLRYTISTD